MPAPSSESFCGLDFGARTAGTTVLVWNGRDGRLHLRACPRQTDADTWLDKLLLPSPPRLLAIDAPLSLPRAYIQLPEKDEPDFFFRIADRQAGAMSPLFLGGLTARAIAFAYRLRQKGCTVLETFPRLVATRRLPESLQVRYRHDNPEAFAQDLSALLPLPCAEPLTSWHDVDALLAWWTAWRYVHHQAAAVGDPEEGQIWY
jgi:predicted nuclease with RNAse H fold